MARKHSLQVAAEKAGLTVTVNQCPVDPGCFIVIHKPDQRWGERLMVFVNEEGKLASAGTIYLPPAMAGLTDHQVSIKVARKLIAEWEFDLQGRAA